MALNWYSFATLDSYAPRSGAGSLSNSSSTEVAEAFNLLPRCDFEEFNEAEKEVFLYAQSLSSYQENDDAAILVRKMLKNCKTIMTELNKGFDDDLVGEGSRRRHTIMEDDVSVIPLRIAHAALLFMTSATRGGRNGLPDIAENEHRNVLQEMVVKDRKELQLALPAPEATAASGSGGEGSAGVQGARSEVFGGTTRGAGGEDAAIASRTRSRKGSSGAESRTARGAGASRDTEMPREDRQVERPGMQLRPKAQNTLAEVPKKQTSRPVIPDVQVWRSTRVRNPGNRPVAAIELKRPALDLRGEFDNAHPASKLTTKGKNLRVRTDITPALKAVCQAILYCLHTESGAVLLTNINSVLLIKAFFPADESKDELSAKERLEQARLTVQVSKLFDKGRVFATYLGYFHYVMKFPGAKHDWGFNAQFMVALNTHSYSIDLVRQNTANASRRITAASSGTMPSVQGADERNAGSVSSASSVEGGNMTSTNDIVMPLLFRYTDMLDMAPPFSIEDIHAIIGDGIEWFPSSERFVVLKSVIGNIPVVAKFAKRTDDEGAMTLLCQELLGHQSLYHSTNGDYGRAVSKLIGYNDSEEYGVVLVTEFVGLAVERDGNTLLCHGEVVCGEEKHKLGVAAMQSLRFMHECGVLHGDINYRNIRAARTKEGRWQVWWIDLGYSDCRTLRDPATSCEIRVLEERECIYLFNF